MEPTDQAEKDLQTGFDRGTYGFTAQDLEALGEEAVRRNLAMGKYGHAGMPDYQFVSSWLEGQEHSRDLRDFRLNWSSRRWLRIMVWVTVASAIVTVISIITSVNS